MTRPRVAGRVLLVFHEEVLGGASLALLRVLPLLETRGWTFECWAPTGGELERELRARGMAVTGLSRQLRFSLASLRQPPGPTARLRSGGRYLRRFSRFVRSGGFDLVHMRYGLDHVGDPRRALEQMARVTRPGGRLLVEHYLPGDRVYRGARRWTLPDSS